MILQDKTGTIDAKIWDPNSAGIAEFDTLDYIEVYGDVNSFQGALQVSVKRVRLCEEGEYLSLIHISFIWTVNLQGSRWELD